MRASVLTTIQHERLENVKRLLSETDESIENITSQCGYGAVNHLKKIFKRTFGVSMRTWRTEHLLCPHLPPRVQKGQGLLIK